MLCYQLRARAEELQPVLSNGRCMGTRMGRRRAQRPQRLGLEVRWWLAMKVGPHQRFWKIHPSAFPSCVEFRLPILTAGSVCPLWSADAWAESPLSFARCVVQRPVSALRTRCPRKRRAWKAGAAPGGWMDTLLVLVFANEIGADAGAQVLHALHGKGALTLYATAII